MKGLIHVYTGNGKGKTTAAVGQVIRALGRGYTVVWLQYCKDIFTNPSGEIPVLKKLGVKLFQYAPMIPFFNPHVKKERVIKECTKSIAILKKIFKTKKYSFVVLDELNVAIANKFISKKSIIKLLKSKPSGIELIITGRGKHTEILNLADLVTEMKEIKHPYYKGVSARKGIEY